MFYVRTAKANAVASESFNRCLMPVHNSQLKVIRFVQVKHRSELVAFFPLKLNLKLKRRAWWKRSPSVRQPKKKNLKLNNQKYIAVNLKINIIIVRGSSSFVINVNADSCIVKVQGFIYFTLTCRISPPHLTSSGTVFFLTPQLLLRRRSARCARLPPAQSEGRNHCVMFIMMSFSVPPKKISPRKRV